MANGQLIYTLTYGNVGTVDIPNAVLSVPVPAGASFVSATGGGALVGNTVEWNLGTLVAGESGQPQFTVQVSAGAVEGSVMLATAELRDGSTGQRLVRAQETTVVKGNIPLVLTVAANPDPVQDDDWVFYEMSVSNQGTTQLRNVVLDSQVPNTGYVDERYHMTGGGYCVSAITCTEHGWLRWDLGTLDPGETKTVLMMSWVGSNVVVPDGTVIHYPMTISYDDVSNGVSDVISLAKDVVVDNSAPPVSLDVDHDGLDNDVENTIGTNVLLWDTDGDGLSDYTEVAYDGDPNTYVAGQDLNPFTVDSDGDGFSDFDELNIHGSDPLDTNSVPILADGDLNADGVVDVVDVLLAQKIVTNQLVPTQNQLDHGNVAPLVNGAPVPDGLFDLGDVLVIQRKALGVINF